MENDVLIPSDSTLAILRQLQKDIIRKIALENTISFFPHFPLWCILDTTDTSSVLQKQIIACSFDSPQISGSRIFCPVTVEFKTTCSSNINEAPKEIKQRQELSDDVASEQYSITLCQSANELEPTATEIIERTLSAFSSIKLPCRVFRIGTAVFSDNEWVLKHSEWVKTKKAK